MKWPEKLGIGGCAKRRGYSWRDQARTIGQVMPASIARAVHRVGREFRHAAIRRASNPASRVGAAVRLAFGSQKVAAAYWADIPNFGDRISPILLKEFLRVDPVHVGKSYRGKLLGAGSVLRFAKSGDDVWGSGLLRPSPLNLEGVRIHAVRGPRTRAQVRDANVPELYGDPGILLPLIYQPRPLTRRFAVGLVPHYVDAGLMLADDVSHFVVDMTNPDWKRVIDEICACDVIVSSSLHGIITAEAYGVPAVWVQPSDMIYGSGFKYHDYYEGTGREAELVSWADGLSRVVGTAKAPPVLPVKPLLESARALRDQNFNGTVFP